MTTCYCYLIYPCNSICPILLTKYPAGQTTSAPPLPPMPGRSASCSGKCSPLEGVQPSGCRTCTCRNQACSLLAVSWALIHHTVMGGGAGGLMGFGDYLCVDCANLPYVGGHNKLTNTKFTSPHSQISVSNHVIRWEMLFPSEFIKKWVQNGGRLPSPWPAFRPTTTAHGKEVFEVSRSQKGFPLQYY